MILQQHTPSPHPAPLNHNHNRQPHLIPYTTDYSSSTTTTTIVKILCASPMQNLLCYPQPLQSRRFPCQDLDLPVLHLAQLLSSLFWHFFYINLLAELYAQYTTIQYAIPSSNVNLEGGSIPPVFLFVLDTCMIEEELDYMKSAMKRAIGLLPDHAFIGLVSFGTQVQVYEPGFSDMSMVYVFRGSKGITKEQVLEQLGLEVSRKRMSPPGGGGFSLQNGMPHAGIKRFLLPASECDRV